MFWAVTVTALGTVRVKLVAEKLNCPVGPKLVILKAERSRPTASWNSPAKPVMEVVTPPWLVLPPPKARATESAERPMSAERVPPENEKCLKMGAGLVRVRGPRVMTLGGLAAGLIVIPPGEAAALTAAGATSGLEPRIENPVIEKEPGTS